MKSVVRKSPTTVFHYAPWEYLARIVESGELQPSAAGGTKDIKPLLWFSANQHWEPTATKPVVDKQGKYRTLTFREQLQLIGCVRFGLSATDPRLMNWKNACTFDGTGRDMRRSMEVVGRRLGADPADWFASAVSISLSELSFEVLLDSWRPAIPAEMVTVWQER